MSARGGRAQNVVQGRRRGIKVNDILERYSRKKLDLSLRLLTNTDGGKPLVLIEGGPDALTLLGALLVTMAKDKNTDGLSLAPDGAGNKHFDPASELGVYITARSIAADPITPPCDARVCEKRRLRTAFCA